MPSNPGLSDDDDTAAMPSCTPSALCGTDTPPRRIQDGRRVAILLFIDMQRENLRFPIGTCVPCLRRGYGKAVRELLRVLLSLRAVHTTLPVHILASGERYLEVESQLAALFNVSFVAGSVPPVHVPSWASKWAKGSFAKLRALALTQYDSLVVLDNDNIPLRNIDHLADLRGFSSVFAYKCFPRRELRAATLVVQPSMADWQRATQLLDVPSTPVYDDLGEQSVWRRLHPRVHELPAGCAPPTHTRTPPPEPRRARGTSACTRLTGTADWHG
jgi:hypothetical protein